MATSVKKAVKKAVIKKAAPKKPEPLPGKNGIKFANANAPLDFYDMIIKFFTQRLPTYTVSDGAQTSSKRSRSIIDFVLLCNYYLPKVLEKNIYTRIQKTYSINGVRHWFCHTTEREVHDMSYLKREDLEKLFANEKINYKVKALNDQ